MTTISPGETLVTIEAGTIENDDHEDIYLKIEAEGRETAEWYMQRHEALGIIKALASALLASEEERD